MKRICDNSEIVLRNARAAMADPDMHNPSGQAQSSATPRPIPHAVDEYDPDWFGEHHHPRDGFLAMLRLIAVILIILGAFCLVLAGMGVTMADLDPTGTVAQVQHPYFDLEQTIAEASK